MLKNKFKNRLNLIQKISLIISDLFAMICSLIFARSIVYFVHPGLAGAILLDTLGLSKSFGLLLIVVFWYQEQYSKRRPTWEEIRILYQTIFVFALLHLSFTYMISHHMAKLLNMLFWVFLLMS